MRLLRPKMKTRWGGNASKFSRSHLVVNCAAVSTYAVGAGDGDRHLPGPPSSSPQPPALGSDKADRRMVDATSRGPGPDHAPDQPQGEPPSAKKVAMPPKETGAPRTGPSSHIENAKSLGSIIIDDPDGEDDDQAIDPKPGILAIEKISGESKRAMESKNALAFDTPEKKDGQKGKPSKAPEKESNEGDSESDGLDSPGANLRRKTVKRKESPNGNSEGDDVTSDGSWGD